jgi:hypothetical protein
VSSPIPIPGSDGSAYMCLWPGRYEWHSERAVAFATDAPCIVQRVMRGKDRGSEWTVRGMLTP